MLIEVDDCLVSTSDLSTWNRLQEKIAAVFDISSSGKLQWFLGMAFGRLSDGRLRVHQTLKIETLARQYGRLKAKPRHTPMDAHLNLRDTTDANSDDLCAAHDLPFRSLLGSIMHIVNWTRPDAAFATFYIARQQAAPTVTHYKRLLRVLDYLNTTKEPGLVFKKGTFSHPPLILNQQVPSTGMSDASSAEEDEFKSTSGGCHHLWKTIVSWYSRKQKSTALSSTEAELLNHIYSNRQFKSS